MTSEEKKKIVARNYFSIDCDVDTTIREAYELGFDRGIQKAVPVVRRDVLKQVLEIIDTAQTYKMFPGQEDTYIDKRVLREAVEALRGERTKEAKDGKIDSHRRFIQQIASIWSTWARWLRNV